MIVGHQKGKTLKERTLCNFGFANPEGYRKAIGKMHMAAKFAMPIICFIDTGGAYPGMGAENAARPIYRQFDVRNASPANPHRLRGDRRGPSGGAGIGVGDRMAMLENAYYSVISPEGCAGII